MRRPHIGLRRPRIGLRIRQRLVLYAAGVALAAVAFFVVLMGSLLAGGVSQNQDATLSGMAASTANALDALPEGATAPANPLVQTDLSKSLDAFVEILDPDGTVLYSTGQLDGAPVAIPHYILVAAAETGSWGPGDIPVGGQEYRLVARLWTRGTDSAVVVAGQTTLYQIQQNNGIGGFLVLSGLITLLLVIIVSWLVAGRAMRPLRMLASTTEEIGRTGDLSRRLTPAATKDEVGALTASFNGMLDRLGAAQDDLTAALASQRQFVADASHELRTPLTTIRTNAEFLREHPDVAPADRAEAIADIAGESSRMSELVDGLLLLARADAGAPLETRPVDLSGLVDEVGQKATRQGRPVKTTAEQAIVEADKAALTRLIWILVDNAFRHGAGDVEMELAVDGGAAILTVADRGRGIPPQDLERVFDRFYRADSARSSPGSGLGLAIARSIAVAHGGAIRALNRDGGGALFQVWLPLMKAPPPGAG
jgi:signal transduction histidine kinase